MFIVYIYRPFHKTLLRSSALVNWISARFYETDCTWRPILTSPFGHCTEICPEPLETPVIRHFRIKQLAEKNFQKGFTTELNFLYT